MRAAALEQCGVERATKRRSDKATKGDGGGELCDPESPRFRLHPSTVILPLLLLLLLPACQTPGGGGASGLPPYLERMRDAYPDAASGRFMALAHFERANQPELFRITSADDTTADVPQPTLSVLRSRNETGGGGLYANLPSTAYELRFDGVRSGELALLRDWSDYHILLMSIFGPDGGLRLRCAIDSGVDPRLSWSRTLDVAPGWNAYRIDLAEVGDAIDLTDVRALRWRVVAPAGSAALFLDDIIIADNTRYLFGADAPAGELYAFEQGRRLHIGAPDRFELAFSDGMISAWYAQTPIETPAETVTPRSMDLAPTRETDMAVVAARPNLAPRTGLGPHPTPLAADWSALGVDAAPPAYDDPNLFADWGRSVVAEQRLLEGSARRAVVQGRWRFLGGDPGASAAASAEGQPVASHAWQYVIYPTGEAFIATASVPPASGWSQPRVGHALCVVGRLGFVCHAPQPPLHAALLTQPGAGPDLLWTPHDPNLAARALTLTSHDERRVAALLGDATAEATVEFAGLLRIWPPDINAPTDALAFAADYQNPPHLTLAVGVVRTNVAGDLDQDGYNEAQGCWEIELAGGAARLTLAPGAQIRHAPRLRLHGSAGRRCWVYVDGRRVADVARDAEQRAIVTLSRLSGAATHVEVHTLPDDSPPGEAAP